MSGAIDTGPRSDKRRVRLRLYVAGDGPNSTAAVRNLRELLSDSSACHVELEVIDVLQTPEQALREGVLVTPMLVKVEPAPERRILGNLSDRATLLSVLEIDWIRHD